MTPTNTIKEILDALASQDRQGNTSLIFKLEPDLIHDAMNDLRGYRKVFAPVISGLNDFDTTPIYAAYERMRQAEETRDSILLLIECQTKQEFLEALDKLPMRNPSERRFLTKDHNDVAGR